MAVGETYEEFVEKFKPKKTTDDCYTPQEVYDCVADWVAEKYGLDRSTFVRPFWPGGDYVLQDDRRFFSGLRGVLIHHNGNFSLFARERVRIAFRKAPFSFMFAYVHNLPPVI